RWRAARRWRGSRWRTTSSATCTTGPRWPRSRTRPARWATPTPGRPPARTPPTWARSAWTLSPSPRTRSTGPKGGARRGAGAGGRGVEVTRLHSGGHQERGMRPGTENVAGIVGLGSAARLARAGLPAAVGAMLDRLEEGLVALGARVHGDRGARVPNTTNV